MDIAVIFNGRAGSAGRVDPAALGERIEAVTGRDVTVIEARTDRDPGACADEARARGARVIVAAGGDGTVSTCAARVIGTSCELGILPLGTSSSFAAALGISSDLEEAIAQLAQPSRRTLDAAIVENGTDREVMVLHCMIGFHAEAIAETEPPAKRRWGVLAYVATAIEKLASLEPFTTELKTESHVVKCRANALAVANLAPPKTILAHGPSHLLGDDGRVDVTIVAAETIAEALATGVHLYRSGRDGEPATRDNVGSFSAARLEIATEPPQHVLVDGEPFGVTPVQITALPHALVVIAPTEAEGSAIQSPLFGLPEVEIDEQPVADRKP